MGFPVFVVASTVRFGGSGFMPTKTNYNTGRNANTSTDTATDTAIAPRGPTQGGTMILLGFD